MGFVMQVADEDAIARELANEATHVGLEHPVGVPARRSRCKSWRPIRADTLLGRGERTAAPSDRGGEEGVP